jgi:hypothetical protein
LSSIKIKTQLKNNEVPKMLSVEISFDTTNSRLQEALDAVDGFFAEYNLPCKVKEPGLRIFTDSGNEERDFVRLWLSVIKIQDAGWIVPIITDGTWTEDEERETLMTTFFAKAS